MKIQALLFSVLFAALAFAGCVDDQDPNEGNTDQPSGSTVTDGENVELTFGPHSGLPEARPEDWQPSLTTAPEWVLGEWWDIEITSGFTGEVTNVKRIAAGKEGDDYLVGMPIEEFDDETMVLHFPCFGLVSSDKLGCEAHDYLFEPLSFPLNEGDSWTSLWQSPNQVTHSVIAVDNDAMAATIQMSGASSGTYTYDANLGVISEFNVPGYESYRVTDHGFDYDGIVRVPYSHDMTIYHGRTGPVLTMQQSQGALQTLGVCAPGNILGGCNDVFIPIETFNIPQVGQSGVEYDRASFALIVFDLGSIATGAVGQTSPVAPGVASITATAPDGTVYDLTKLPTDAGHTIDGYGHDDPAGDWQLQIVNGGAYAVFIEGITYTTFDVSLPTGCVVVDEDIHDHGGECGGHVHNIE